MKITPIKLSHVLLLAITASLALPVPDAGAESLLKRLFGKHPRQSSQIRKAPVEVERKAVRKIKKIQTARFYTYRPKPLTKFKFAALSATTLVADYQPQLGGVETNKTLFAEALAQAGNINIRARGDVAKAVIAHYRANPEFMWISSLEPNSDATDMLGLFNSADSYGLDAADYAVKLPQHAANGTASNEVLASLIEFEVTMSLRAIRYALDANGGRVNPNKLSGYHDFPAKKLNATKVMAALMAAANRSQRVAVAANDVSTPIQTTSTDAGGPSLKSSEFTLTNKSAPANYLLSLHPSHPSFAIFRQELAKLNKSVDDTVVIAPGTLIKPGKSSVEMPNVVKAIGKRGSKGLLEKHADTLANYQGFEEYTPELVALVKDFQKENKLKPDGVVGRRSIAKLSGTSVATKINRVVLAMERLRWHPRKFGNRYVFINQPAFRATYLTGGKEQFSMRIVVGKKSNQTNFFYDKIEKVVYNPYWGVPRSILVNEMLPKLRKNPSYLDQAGYEVTTLSGKRISSASVDWYSVGSNFGYNVRQTPGPKNALGRLKILFPNKHAIYMHDTPAKSLFKRTSRAYSHGCVRLQQPKKMAAAVLGTNISFIKSRLKGGTKTQLLKSKVPVYVAYFTAWPKSSGEVSYYRDMYDRDKYLLKALKKTSVGRSAS